MSNPGEWSFVAVHDVLAATAPDRDMVACRTVRRTFAEVAERTKSIAAFLLERGVGIHAERAELERWESGQDPVALRGPPAPEPVQHGRVAVTGEQLSRYPEQRQRK